MVQLAINDYFPDNYPVYAHNVEVKNGDSIPTYFMMKKLQQMYPGINFHFIIGSDLFPWLSEWDEGKKLVDEIGIIVIERGGHEEKMNPENS